MLLKELLKNPSTPLQKINDTSVADSGVELFIKRLDLIHPEISGNKWFKLKYNLFEANKGDYDTLLTFGGAYSNHIYATAAAGKLFGFKTIGIIRGEKHIPLNPTLTFAKEHGMIINYLDRISYRDKYNAEFLSSIKAKYENFYLIPEGGTNPLAVKGCKEILNDIDIPFDCICTACGTGGTLAGLITGLRKDQRALGFSVLKDGAFLINEIDNLLNITGTTSNNNWQIVTNYHFGGYAKITKELIDFISDFENQNGIKLEPIYSGKMMFGIYEMIKQGVFPKGSKIIALHNGGMQGLKGFKKLSNFWKI